MKTSKRFNPQASDLRRPGALSAGVKPCEPLRERAGRSQAVAVRAQLVCMPHPPPATAPQEIVLWTCLVALLVRIRKTWVHPCGPLWVSVHLPPAAVPSGQPAAQESQEISSF